MQLYRKLSPEDTRLRKRKNINITIEEKPERPIYVFKSARDREKYVLSVEALIRKSGEYKQYIKFLKEKMDWNRCAILKNAKCMNGKRYSIEIHHEPFTLFDIVDTVLNKFDLDGISYNMFSLAEEVMALHYDGKVGLISLTKTQHELLHNGKIFIPLQFIYHDYGAFFKEYEPYMGEDVKEKIKIKAEMSMKCDQIQSNVLDPTFVYINIDGFDFPTVPDDWDNGIGKPVTVPNSDEGVISNDIS